MSDTSARVTLVWTEEQEIFQRLYSAVFTEESSVRVVNSIPFGNNRLLDESLKQFRPEILLIGCKNISNDLLEEIRRMQEKFDGLGIILLASALKYEDLILIRQFVQNTRLPFGFLFKRSLSRTEQLFNAISLVRMGQIVMDPALSNLLSSDKEKSPATQGLTAREMEILNLIARGFTNTAISEQLFIDVKTVRHHINNIYSKLQTMDKFDNKHPRVNATNLYLRLTGQLAFDDSIIE